MIPDSEGSVSSIGVNNLSVALSKTMFTLRERYNPDDAITMRVLSDILTELNIETSILDKMGERIEFKDDDDKMVHVHELLSQMEDIRASVEDIHENNIAIDGGDGEMGVENIWSNSAVISSNSYAASSKGGTFDPWRRTISQLSMSSALEQELPLCQVSVQIGEREGSFYDRHQKYLISLPSNGEDCKVARRYKDFEWLREELIKRHPFRLLPQLPPKSFTYLIWKDMEVFLEARQRGLEEFLFFIANHPIIQKDLVLVQFFSVEDFSLIRKNPGPVIEEEFENKSEDKMEDNPIMKETDSEQIYKDAQSWITNVEECLDEIIKDLLQVANNHQNIGSNLSRLSGNIGTILEQTHHSTSVVKNIPNTFKNLSITHERVAKEVENDIVKLYLFHRLVLGFQESIGRTRNLKYSQFPWLSNQILSYQARADKLRLREGSDTPSNDDEIDRILNRVTVMQQEMIFQIKRNGFADECLKEEIGWVVKMSLRILPSSFNLILSNLSLSR